MIDFARARKAMVDSQLQAGNISSRRLLATMGRLPRERFVPADRQSLAYIDEAHPLLPGRSRRALAAPVAFARLVQLAEVQPDDRVLDLGCGTGYSTAVLAALAAHVVGVEEHEDLAATARDTLAALGVGNAEIVAAPLDRAAAAPGLFDAIIVEGAVKAVPEALFGRLAEGGRLVVVVSDGITAEANLFVRTGTEVAGRAEFNVTLPPLADAEAAEAFVF